MSEENIYTVGSRVLIRDAEWRISKVDLADRGYKLTCQGLSTLVRGKDFEFFTIFEDSIEVLRPEDTILVRDISEGFRDTKLFLESMLRTSPITYNDKITIANGAAIDSMPYQFNPALQALKQSRARILIADAVGIGKTMEAGILASELIRRGRGRRILVLTVKSVLDQFQQEFWNRFSIPLMPLDSEHIRSIQNKIPQNHNPLLYFDRAIISIDTLKNTARYRDYIKDAYWDIIIIDEAHNVAERSRSQRSQLAKLLANRSDSLIMLTATPHDGTAKSFASLLDLLDPTVIADPEHYTVNDYANKGLVIRRFKNDIESQLGEKFPERITNQIDIEASPEEKEVYKKLETFFSKTYDNHSKGIRLFSTLLTKAMFSSPEACKSVIDTRIKTLKAQKRKLGGKEDEISSENTESAVEVSPMFSAEKASEMNLENSTSPLQNDVNANLDLNKTVEDQNPQPTYELTNKKQIPEEKIKAIDNDIKNLNELLELVKKITPDKWTKLDYLVEMLNSEKATDGWNSKAFDDRIVIFTESIPTLKLLQEELPKRSGLKDKQIICMRGDMSDVELTSYIQDFNNPKSEARVLICSDVASEGINLHHLSHRLIHFDIPWSLMTFQQRNGRIDRYGQKKQPYIQYLQTVSGGTQAMQFVDVLTKLVDKDKKAHENLSDPFEFSLSEKQQVEHTAAQGEGHGDEWKEEQIKEQKSDEDYLDEAFTFFPEDVTSESWDPSVESLQTNEDGTEKSQPSISPVLSEEEFKKDLLKIPSLFKSDFDFVSRVLSKVAFEEKWTGVHIDSDKEEISFSPPERSDLRTRLKYLPSQILPKGGRFFLTSKPKEIMAEMEHARSADEPWPAKQLLWSLHPVTDWAVEKGLTQYGRHKAPLVPLGSLEKGETWYLLQGGFSNMRGYRPVHAWIAVREVNGDLSRHTMEEFLEKSRFDREAINYSGIEIPDLSTFKEPLGKAVKLAEEYLVLLKKKFDDSSKKDLEKKKQDLQKLEEKHKEALDKVLNFAETQVVSNTEKSTHRETFADTASSKEFGESDSSKQFSSNGQTSASSTGDGVENVESQENGNQQKNNDKDIQKSRNPWRKKLILMKEQKLAEIRETFKHAESYLTETATLEDKPYLQLAAVFTGIKSDLDSSQN